MRSVLITGGLGFLGQHLVSAFSEEGDKVRILARPSALKQTNTENDVTVWGDIRDLSAVERAVEGCDLVIHTVSNFRRGGSDKGEAYDINVLGTENVLKASQKYGVKRLIHCSTIGVHGNVREIPANEETVFNPGDLYQETKLTAEQKVWAFYKETALPITVIRPISMLGPGDMRMLKLFRMIKKGRFIMIGPGEAFFQPAYIDDVVAGFLLCARHEKAVGEAFILGSEEYLPLKKLVVLIADLLKVPPPRLRIPLKPVEFMAGLCEQICTPLGIEPPLHKRRVSFFKNNRAFSIQKAKTVIGYAPKVSLEDGLRRTISWYEENGHL